MRKNHIISGLAVKRKIIVKSYHDYGFNEKLLAKNFKVLAQSSDKVIKFFCHNHLKIFGIMWHPERNKNFKKFDINLFKKIFNK